MNYNVFRLISAPAPDYEEEVDQIAQRRTDSEFEPLDIMNFFWKRLAKNEIPSWMRLYTKKSTISNEQLQPYRSTQNDPESDFSIEFDKEEDGDEKNQMVNVFLNWLNSGYANEVVIDEDNHANVVA